MLFAGGHSVLNINRQQRLAVLSKPPLLLRPQHKLLDLWILLELVYSNLVPIQTEHKHEQHCRLQIAAPHFTVEHFLDLTVNEWFQHHLEDCIEINVELLQGAWHHVAQQRPDREWHYVNVLEHVPLQLLYYYNCLLK